MRKRWRWKSVVVVLGAVLAMGVSACESDGESNGPTSPSPPPAIPTPPAPSPRANLQPVGTPSWESCVSAPANACTFRATLRNTGTGCAVRIEGVVRFFNTLGTQIGTTYRFALPPQQLVNTGETVSYTVLFVPLATASATVDYSVAPVWVDAPCF